MDHYFLLDILAACRLPAKFCQLISDTYTCGELLYNSPDGESRIPERTGVKSFCLLSPVLFNLFSAGLINSAPLEDGYSFASKERIPAAAFADNICLLSATEKQLQAQLKAIETAGRHLGFRINFRKTKTIVMDFREGKSGTIRQHRFTCGETALRALKKNLYSDTSVSGSEQTITQT